MLANGTLMISPAPKGIIETRMMIDIIAPNMKSSKTYPFEMFALFLIDSTIPHSSSMRKYS